jgi:two-component system response regulator AtoC
MRNATILVVDDEPLIRWALAERLRTDGYEVVEAATGHEAIARIADGVDLVLLDYQLPDLDGVGVLKRFKERDPDVVVILLTAYASIETAVEAMKAGAYDVAHKPFDLDDISLSVAKALEITRLRRELSRLRANQAHPYGFDRIVGQSPAILRLRPLLGRLAASPASTVLVTGESGTGKDLVARVLHYSSDRARRPFVAVSCSAVPEALLEGTLFGYERNLSTAPRNEGRGVFEQADGGTVYLEEIGAMAPTAQGKLLRVLEEHAFTRVGGSQDIPVNAGLVAATTCCLAERVRTGGFREDLYDRLNVLSVVLPPLRDRREDLPALVAFYIDMFNQELGKNVRGASPDAVRQLRAYDWPGNIRELRNAVERAMLLADGPWLDVREFPALSARHQPPHGIALPAEGLDLEQLEKSLVIQALERSGYNQTRAATLLGLHRDQIRYRIEKFGLLRHAAS